ncbi:MAG: tetratricopeptide repeat protein, partial [Bdellovibrionota bacterium]
YDVFLHRDGSAEAQLQVAETLYLCERDDMALAAYREVMKKGVADPQQLFAIYKNVGNIHVRAGDYESAEEYYDKAYTIFPESDILLVNYGTLEIQRGSWDAAVERFRQAVAANAQNDRAWVGLAMVHRTMGDLELAKGNVERALDINPSNRTALKLAVEWSIQDYEYGPALRRLEAYVSDAGGEDAEMCFIFAKLLVQAGRLSQARIELERVLALDPGIEGGDALARALDRELIRSQRVAPTDTGVEVESA